ncbi:MAG TPA: thioredoxin family protein [Flavobacterium sp.]|nr:thioredoxin family protein [Flavobacterium sp.]
MSKFGELISGNVPVLLFFTSENMPTDHDDRMEEIVHELAAETKSKLSIVKINVDKNETLIEALRVRTTPTLMLYKDSSMVWRQSGMTDLNSLRIIAKAFY